MNSRKPEKVKCPVCKRKVGVMLGAFYTHGPGPNGEFTCPNSQKDAPRKNA